MESIKVSPMLIFFIALALFGLFVAYFAVEKERGKRVLGTLLASGVTAFTLFYLIVYPMPKGIDLKGGTEFELHIKPEEGKVVDAVAQQQVITTLQRRLDADGVSDLTMTPQGDDRILLTMAVGGKQDQLLSEEERAKKAEEEREKVLKILKTTAKLEFALVAEGSSPFLVGEMKGGKILPGKDWRDAYDEETGRPEVIEIGSTLKGDIIATAWTSFETQGYQINVKLKPSAAEKMSALSGANVGRGLAIIVDNKVVSAPIINSQLGEQFVITGQFKQEEADQLATFLKNPLANPIEVANQSQVSPELGEATIRQGWIAGIAGLAATLIFVMFFYRVAGLIATFALCLNVVIIFGVMSAFRFDLTMPGIAGILLTIGVSIDANVLIYERLREELKAGKTPKAALEASYDKAFSAIFDSNLTGLIAGFALLWISTGTIKGFAITTIIGIFGSLFTALLVTRVCFSWLLHWNFLKKLNMSSIVKETNFDFLGWRKIGVTISFVLLLLSFLWFGARQENVLAVGLRGGDQVTVKASSEKLSVPALKDSLAKANFSLVPIVKEQKPLDSPDTYYTIQVAEKEGEQVLQTIKQDFGIPVTDMGMEAVGSSVGKELLTSAAWAIVVGMLGITIYLTVRFEFAFALGALVGLIHDLIVTAAIVTLMGKEISMLLIGALLTIAGYSINDTIVVFDRLREGLKTKRGDLIDVMNYSLNATLSRTVLTGMTTLFVLFTLLLFGGPSLNEFALTLILGIVIGTYSSIFVASPVVLWWAKIRKINLRHEVMDSEQSKIAGPAATNA